MKKVLQIATIVAIIGCASAQTDKGGLLVGASSSFGYSSTSYDDPTVRNTTSFDLDVRTGYFLMDNLVLGLNIGYEKEKQGDDETTTTLVGPFVRYYIIGTFFIGTSYSLASIEEVYARAGEKTDFRFLAFEAGYPIWIVEKIAIEPSLNYGVASGKDILNSKTFGLSIGFSLYF